MYIHHISYIIYRLYILCLSYPLYSIIRTCLLLYRLNWDHIISSISRAYHVYQIKNKLNLVNCILNVLYCILHLVSIALFIVYHMWAWLKYWMDKLESRAFYHLCPLEDYYQTPVNVKFREVRMDCPDMSMQELRQALLKILFHTFPQKYRKNGRNSPCQPRWWLNQPIWKIFGKWIISLTRIGVSFQLQMPQAAGARRCAAKTTKHEKPGRDARDVFHRPEKETQHHGRMENVAVMRWALSQNDS